MVFSRVVTVLLGSHFPLFLLYRKEVWSQKMNDSVLDLAATDDGTVFAALADGLVAVIQARNRAQSIGLVDPSHSHPRSPSPLLPSSRMYLTVPQTLTLSCSEWAPQQ